MGQSDWFRSLHYMFHLNYKIMTKENTIMIKRAIDTHISMLYRQVEAYIKQANFEAKNDCLKEIRKFINLKATL